MSAHWLGAGYVIPPALLVLAIVAAIGVRGGLPPALLALRLAVVAYAAGLVAASFFPLPLPPYQPDSSTSLTPVNLVPFRTISESLRMGIAWPVARVMAGNLLAFMPLGLLLPVFAHRPSASLVLLAGLAVSGAIEVTQGVLTTAMGIPYRIADVDDILLNVVGVAFGLACFRLGRRLLRHEVRTRKDPRLIGLLKAIED
jgi:glycopeptide antibiotics resistance protein